MEDAPAFRDFKTPRIALFVACSEPLFSRILINIELNFSSVAHQGRVKAEFPERPTSRIPISSQDSPPLSKKITYQTQRSHWHNGEEERETIFQESASHF